jgi:hypothetical protein
MSIVSAPALETTFIAITTTLCSPKLVCVAAQRDEQEKKEDQNVVEKSGLEWKFPFSAFLSGFFRCAPF